MIGVREVPPAHFKKNFDNPGDAAGTLLKKHALVRNNYFVHTNARLFREYIKYYIFYFI